MCAARKTAEEQYQLILECRRSGMADCDWCRENGINPEIFCSWIARLKKRGDFPVSPASRHPANCLSRDIVRVDVLPEEAAYKPSYGKNTLVLSQEVQTKHPALLLK